MTGTGAGGDKRGRSVVKLLDAQNRSLAPCGTGLFGVGLLGNAGPSGEFAAVVGSRRRRLWGRGGQSRGGEAGGDGNEVGQGEEGRGVVVNLKCSGLCCCRGFLDWPVRPHQHHPIRPLVRGLANVSKGQRISTREVRGREGGLSR